MYKRQEFGNIFSLALDAPDNSSGFVVRSTASSRATFIWLPGSIPRLALEDHYRMLLLPDFLRAPGQQGISEVLLMTTSIHVRVE